MEKETFVKLVNAYTKNQKMIRTFTFSDTKTAWGMFSDTIFGILENECELFWWITQKPQVAYHGDIEYPVETPEELWEYTQICNNG